MVHRLKLICFSSILMKIGEVVHSNHGHWALEHHQVISKSDLTIYKLGAGEFGLRMKTNTIYVYPLYHGGWYKKYSLKSVT